MVERPLSLRVVPVSIPDSPRKQKHFCCPWQHFVLPFLLFLLVLIPHLSDHRTPVVCHSVTATPLFLGISKKVLGRLPSVSGSSAFTHTITSTSFSRPHSIRVSFLRKLLSILKGKSLCKKPNNVVIQRGRKKLYLKN